MRVLLNGSGGIDDIVFARDPGEIGDTVFCDVDDDGQQDPGDPGIPGVLVELACVGPVGSATPVLPGHDGHRGGTAGGVWRAAASGRVL